MKPADSKPFRECLLAMSEVYGREVSSAVASLWWQALERFEFEAVAAAFRRHVQSPDVGQFMPKPADVIRMLEGTSVDVAQVAWAKVDKAVRTIGTYQTVVFDDALIHRVVHDMGGWIGIGQKSLDEWPFVGNEFRTRYGAFRSRQESPEYPAKLLGITEADNAHKGYAVHEVVFVGDPAKATQVLAGGTDKPMVGFQRVSGDTLPGVSNVRALPNRRAQLEVVGEAK